jgi:hypothetical protein
MTRVPTFGPAPSREADDDPPRRLGRAGLDALMRDPRYFDPDHPEHGQVVDLVRRGFEIVFAAPKVRDWPRRAPSSGAPRVSIPMRPRRRAIRTGRSVNPFRTSLPIHGKSRTCPRPSASRSAVA